MASVPNSRLFLEGGATGFVGAAVAVVAWLAAEAAGVPTLVEVPNMGVQALTWVDFVAVGVLSGLGASLVALLVDGRRGSRRIFTTIAVLALVASIAAPALQPDEVALSTRVVLAVLHGVVYLAVVPRLAGRLRAR